DIDGDGICYRTLPGTNHPAAAYFTRGTGHNQAAAYSERPEDWSANLVRLAKKHDHARTLIPAPIIVHNGTAEVGLIAYGTSDPALQEARDLLQAEGIPSSYLRLRALPLESQLTAFIKKHKRLYVVENNLDGQMRALIQLHAPADADRIISIAKCDGLPLTARWICEAIKAYEAKEQP
ncbi:MAG: 2-oxoacid:acceptor oxidoreductase subunit alpha, partial [Trichlorobacter sp.]|nr:2-oxoacid:acceptor oxidoreductase subunit alpha [Trichlorobacter sp.]